MSSEDNLIESKLKIISNLNKETVNSYGIILIKGKRQTKSRHIYSYNFKDINVTLGANIFSELLEKVIKYILTNRVYLVKSDKYPCGVKRKVQIKKYRLK